MLGDMVFIVHRTARSAPDLIIGGNADKKLDNRSGIRRPQF